MHHLSYTVFFATLCFIGCNNGTPTPPPPPVNNTPTFTSATMASVAENISGTIYTATANDADNDTLSFSISGTDAALFVLDTMTGDLSFTASPDFENPADSDGDNVYDVTITVSDGRNGMASLNLSLTLTNIDQNFQIRRVGTGFARPLYLEGLPDGTGRVLVLEKNGKIRLFDPDTGVIEAVDFLDVSGDISTEFERGLLGLALAPDFATSGDFYLNVTNLAGDTEIRHYQTEAGRLDIADPASKDVILTVGQPVANHNAGWIGFDANGLLLIPLGDGGGGGDPNNFAQNPMSLLGKVLRIDVNGDAFPSDDLRDYAIPVGNTFTNSADGLPEIFAIGLRNPYRSSFDPTTGDLLIADVGQNAIEEIDRLPVTDSSLNFGWNVVEGTMDFNGTADPSFTPPVAEYSHDGTERGGRSVTGGYVYTGPVEALQSEYIFADFAEGNIWSLPAADMQNGSTILASQFKVLTSDFTPNTGDLSLISSFGLDEVGNLYILDFNGDIFRLEAE